MLANAGNVKGFYLFCVVDDAWYANGRLILESLFVSASETLPLQV